MATYQPYQKKSFKLKKEARAWLSDFKKKNQLGDQKFKVETNYIANDPQPWQAVVMRKV